MNSRLTKRIGSQVYYTKGRYAETTPAEMDTKDVRNVLCKLAEYEEAEEKREEQITEEYARLCERRVKMMMATAQLKGGRIIKWKLSRDVLEGLLYRVRLEKPFDKEKDYNGSILYGAPIEIVEGTDVLEKIENC